MKEAIIQYNDTPSGGHLAISWKPLIRCKDCRWGEPTKNAYGEDRIICGNDDTYVDRYITVPADWYCADGELRD